MQSGILWIYVVSVPKVFFLHKYGVSKMTAPYMLDTRFSMCQACLNSQCLRPMTSMKITVVKSISPPLSEACVKLRWRLQNSD